MQKLVVGYDLFRIGVLYTVMPEEIEKLWNHYGKKIP